MVIRSQPREEAAFLAMAGLRIEIRKLKHVRAHLKSGDCPPLYLPLSFSFSLFFLLLKFRALGVSFTALPTANWQLAFWDNPILGHVKAEVATQDIY